MGSERATSQREARDRARLSTSARPTIPACDPTGAAPPQPGERVQHAIGPGQLAPPSAGGQALAESGSRVGVDGPEGRERGKLQFYTPEQVRQLMAHAYSELDKAVYTVATQAGPRLSEIRALKVGNVDFEVGVLRFEDGFTTTGGHTGNKGRRVRSVPVTNDIRTALAPFCRGKTAEKLVFEQLRQARRADLRCGALPALRPRQQAGRSAATALARPAAHVRNAGDPRLQDPRSPADDGPPPHHHHHRTLPALRTRP